MKLASRALVLALIVSAFAASVAPAGARTADTKGWCNAVIQVNTKYGTMKNKRFLLPGQFPASAWKRVVDATLADRDRFIALAPDEIKTAVKHQMAWLAKVKKNNYAFNTPLAPMTLAEVNKITNFEKTKCGIRFGS